MLGFTFIFAALDDTESEIRRFLRSHVLICCLHLEKDSRNKRLGFLDYLDIRVLNPLVNVDYYVQQIILLPSFRNSMFSIIISRSVRHNLVSSKRMGELNTNISYDSDADQG